MLGDSVFGMSSMGHLGRYSNIFMQGISGEVDAWCESEGHNLHLVINQVLDYRQAASSLLALSLFLSVLSPLSLTPPPPTPLSLSCRQSLR